MSDWDSLYALAAGESASKSTNDTIYSSLTSDSQRCKRERCATDQSSVFKKKEARKKEKHPIVKRKSSSVCQWQDPRLLLPSKNCRWGRNLTTKRKGEEGSTNEDAKDKPCRCSACAVSVLKFCALGPSVLGKDVCIGWSEEQERIIEKFDDDITRKCKHCFRSPLYHKLVRNEQTTSQSANETMQQSVECDPRKRVENFLIDLFMMVRNIRSTASCCNHIGNNCDGYSSILQCTSNVSTTTTSLIHEIERSLVLKICEWSTFVGTTLSEMSTKLRPLFSLLTETANERLHFFLGEMQILRNRAKMLDGAMTEWRSLLLQLNSGGIPRSQNESYCLFRCKVKALIAIDSLYYRLHYLTVTNLFVGITKLVVPGPCIYFGTDGMSWDISSMRGAAASSNDEWTCDLFSRYVVQGKAKKNHHNSPSTVAATTLLEDKAHWIEEHFDLKGLLDDQSPADQEQKEAKCVSSSLGNTSNRKEKNTKRNPLQSFYHDNKNESMDPLCYLYQNRLWETVLLFFGASPCLSSSLPQSLPYKFSFLESEDIHSEMVSALQNGPCRHLPTTKHGDGTHDNEASFFKRHEAVAPPLLQEWRDSCRDPLCSLYAYATISPSVMSRLPQVFQELGIEKVVEVGAGTGYVSSLMRSVGVDVAVAWDVAPPPPSPNVDFTSEAANNVDEMEPPSSWNEYHGKVPSYFPVRQGTSQSLLRLFDEVSSPPTIALFLCYPPPSFTNKDSSDKGEEDMALDCLERFMSVGGRHLVYVGEFVGLTASSAFEERLTARFDCRVRYSCLTWGTDAATLTVWTVKTSTFISTPFLLPCSHCGTKAAVSRCTLARDLCYCSNDCFHKHRHVRNCHLRFLMIPTKFCADDVVDDHAPSEGTIMTFHNPQYFVALQKLRTLGCGEKTKQRKKRNRKRKK